MTKIKKIQVNDSTNFIVTIYNPRTVNHLARCSLSKGTAISSDLTSYQGSPGIQGGEKVLSWRPFGSPTCLRLSSDCPQLRTPCQHNPIDNLIARSVVNRKSLRVKIIVTGGENAFISYARSVAYIVPFLFLRVAPV